MGSADGPRTDVTDRLSYDHDLAGRLVSASQDGITLPGGGAGVTTTYVYDDAGERVRVTQPLTSTLTQVRDWTYDAAGRTASYADYRGITTYRSRQEVTPLPTELLWGPGSGEDAIAWLEVHQPLPDEIEYLDRWFVVRRNDQGADIPQRPGIVAGLSAAERAGEWFLVRADFPSDAGGHVREVVSGRASCAPTGPCQRCAAEIARVGEWDDIVGELTARRVRITPVNVRDVRVPIHERP